LSYEAIGALIRRHIPLYELELEKFFRLVLSNYIISNGDAHVKNFSAIHAEAGDYVFTPAYNLLCTRIHLPGESDMALELLKNRYTEDFQANGFYTLADFKEFGRAIGIKRIRVTKIINEFTGKDESIDYLIDRSFLKGEVKADFKGLQLSIALIVPMAVSTTRLLGWCKRYLSE